MRSFLRGGALVIRALGVALFLYSIPGLLLHLAKFFGARPSLEVGLPFIVAPAYVMFEHGLRRPFVDWGGGAVWLTPIGLLLCVAIPGLVLATAGHALQRTLKERRPVG